ncbi:ThuA domain-containing protein [Plantactinospora endophytica]|uniref:Trehalose utilization protein ThuA n=1 Tax=Plantactinospora endophytica TaxID=673535 RepID=A0ABQ4E1P4_9ACTN|nr:ThuA domain-containing protein [Plantactinospora endophytica]GIG88587.1 trehalose utilization protein ThuA [Plantactinospora endophytica]
MQVTVWNEGLHERAKPEMAEIYPDGIHGAIADALRSALPDAEVRTGTLDEPHQGLPPELLDRTEVLLWWGHRAHEQVEDGLVDRIAARVLGGMGLLVLHSGHYSKVFRKLMGTTCSLAWRNEGERELVWTTDPSHPIAAGVDQPIVIGEQEMYGEPFDIPSPDEVVFISSFAGGEVFRSGVTFRRGRGRVFYFSPGDEAYPVYRHPQIQRVLANAVRWAMPGAPVVAPARAVKTPRADWHD